MIDKVVYGIPFETFAVTKTVAETDTVKYLADIFNSIQIRQIIQMKIHHYTVREKKLETAVKCHMKISVL